MFQFTTNSEAEGAGLGAPDEMDELLVRVAHAVHERDCAPSVQDDDRFPVSIKKGNAKVYVKTVALWKKKNRNYLTSTLESAALVACTVPFSYETFKQKVDVTTSRGVVRKGVYMVRVTMEAGEPLLPKDANDFVEFLKTSVPALIRAGMLLVDIRRENTVRLGDRICFIDFVGTVHPFANQRHAASPLGWISICDEVNESLHVELIKMADKGIDPLQQPMAVVYMCLTAVEAAARLQIVEQDHERLLQAFLLKVDSQCDTAEESVECTISAFKATLGLIVSRKRVADTPV